jgi:hypothetical protein
MGLEVTLIQTIRTVLCAPAGWAGIGFIMAHPTRVPRAGRMG